MKEEVIMDLYRNGQLCREIPYVDGLIHGFFKFWNSNGKLRFEIPHVYGKEHGLKKCWHYNGQLHYEIPLKKNFQCGAKIEFEY